ncbi:MAG: dihydrofolate reductase, partial [Actinophytocola sp.]
AVTAVSTVVVNAFLTLDGVAQAPGQPEEDRDGAFPHGGWQVPYFTEEQGELVGRWQGRAAGLLLGRRTYDIFAAH